jgi:hypothetical protein
MFFCSHTNALAMAKRTSLSVRGPLAARRAHVVRRRQDGGLACIHHLLVRLPNSLRGASRTPSMRPWLASATQRSPLSSQMRVCATALKPVDWIGPHPSARSNDLAAHRR